MNNIIIYLTTENQILCNVLTFPLAIIEFYLLYYCASSFFNTASHTNDKLSFVFILACCTSIIRLTNILPLNWLVNLILIFICIKFILKLNFVQTIITFSIYLIGTTISEFLFSIIITKLLKLDLYYTSSIPIYKLLFTILIDLIIFLLYTLSNKLKNNITVFNNLSPKETYSIIINIGTIALMIGPNIIFMLSNNLTVPTTYIIYNLLVCSALFFINLYNNYKFAQLDITTRELETAKMYNSTLSQLVDNNRGFKHDMNNMIQAIGGYIELNDMNGLKHYYDTGLLPSINKINNLAMFNPDLINSPPVFALFIAKKTEAEQEGITFKFSSFFDYSNINLDVFTFCKIMGILLDNAKDASKQCVENKIIELHVSIDFINRKQCFQIKNTYTNKEVDINEIFTKDYSTKKEKSGFGLWEVKQIISKLQNVNLVTKKDDIFFTQKLEIYF